MSGIYDLKCYKMGCFLNESLEKVTSFLDVLQMEPGFNRNKEIQTVKTNKAFLIDKEVSHFASFRSFRDPLFDSSTELLVCTLQR